MKKSAKPVKSKLDSKAAKSAPKPSKTPVVAPPKPPVSLDHCLMARIKYVGWIQALQTDMQFQLDCIPQKTSMLASALASAYDLLQAHDGQAWKWYGSDYRPEIVVGIGESDTRRLIWQSYEKE